MRRLLSPKFLLITVLCAGTAFVVSMLCRDYAVKAAVPVTFLLVLVPVVVIGGRIAGLAVTIVATFIFAAYLFEPYGSLAIRSSVDRIELLLFVLAGIAVVHFSPSPALLESIGTTIKASDQLEKWVAVVGYAVIYTAVVTLLLFLLDSMRYKE